MKKARWEATKVIKVEFYRNDKEQRNELNMEIHTEDGEAGILAETTLMIGAIINAVANKTGLMSAHELFSYMLPVLPVAIRATVGETTVIENETHAGGGNDYD